MERWKTLSVAVEVWKVESFMGSDAVFAQVQLAIYLMAQQN